MGFAMRTAFTSLSDPSGIQSCKARNSTWKHWRANSAPTVMGCMMVPSLQPVGLFFRASSRLSGNRKSGSRTHLSVGQRELNGEACHVIELAYARCHNRVDRSVRRAGLPLRVHAAEVKVSIWKWRLPDASIQLIKTCAAHWAQDRLARLYLIGFYSYCPVVPCGSPSVSSSLPKRL